MSVPQAAHRVVGDLSEFKREITAMVITWSKILALAMAFAYIVFAIIMSNELPVGVCLLLIVPLALIWFPDVISGFASPDRKYGMSRGFTSPTPAYMVTIVGWVGLVGYLPLLGYLLCR